MANSIVQSIALDFQKKNEGKEKMKEKKFDSVEDILKISEENHIPMYNIQLGFIVNLYDYLESECNSFIYGSPAKDFFIQGLISIIANPKSFEQALENFMDRKNLK